MKSYFLLPLAIIIATTLAISLKCTLDEASTFEFDCYEEFTSVCETSRVYDNSLQINQNPVFFGRDKIEVPPYQFLSDNHLIQSDGEQVLQEIINNSNCCNVLESLDDLGKHPTFEWLITTTNNLYAAAIFKKQPQLRPDGSSIKNIEDIVWTWNSGLNTGSQSGGKITVRYEDGKDLINGELQNTLTRLDEGFTYTWMAWAWNSDGTDIVASSIAIPFKVGTPQAQPISLLSILGEWDLESAIKLPSGLDAASTFPIRRMWFYQTSVEFSSTEFGVLYIDGTEEYGLLIEKETTKCRVDLTKIPIIESIEEGKMLCDNRLFLKLMTTSGLYEIIFHKR